jgi:hypothetical protein
MPAPAPDLRPPDTRPPDVRPPDAPVDRPPDVAGREAATPDVAPDGSAPDASVPDASALDAPAPDASAPDASAPDASAADVRVPAVGCPTDPDLLLCMRFEGSLRDESASGHVFTSTGTGFTSGVDGLALNHMATSDVRLANTTAFDVARVTLEAWVQPRTLPAGTARAAIVDYQREFSLFVYPDGSVRCAVNDGSSTPGEARMVGAVQPGVWTSLACTAEVGMVSLWVDGVLRVSTPLTAFLPNTGGAAGLYIGTNIPADTTLDRDPFDGLIDNVRVWRRLRTAPEICAAAIGCAP